MGKSFFDKLLAKWSEDKFLCIGLDLDSSKLPSGASFFVFNKKIIDATSDLVCCYKPNIAFYEARGIEGWKDLLKTIQYIKKTHPDIPIILDAKRGDIGNTSLQYARAYFDTLGVDAVTVHPYQGMEALTPFLDYKDKGTLVLVRTSNPGAREYQDLPTPKEPLYIKVAKGLVKKWNKNGNIGLVVGATYPKELAEVRKIAPNQPILIPGVGAQKGELEDTIKAGLTKNGDGIIINASRSVIFAPSPRKAAEELNQKIRSFIK